jgi:membrane protein insertase Oxa1/YidC/SpoIIIJ
MKIQFKKSGLVFTTLALFTLSIYLAFAQGSMGGAGNGITGAAHFAAPADMSPIVYTGIRASMANISAGAMNVLMAVFANNILISIIALAMLVELALLYPSVRIQLKQKKIHFFHKKLVDSFNRGEIEAGEARREIDVLYAVNEKLHAKGAFFVAAQIIVFFMVLWGLNLLVNVPYLVRGSWSVFNFSLLNKPTDFWIPLIVSLLYFMHSVSKVYYKEKDDYISPSQSVVAIGFAVMGAAIVYWFASAFPAALSFYVVTLIAFSTVRYVIVEQNAQSWGKLAQRQLAGMLDTTKPYKDKFEYLSQKWNHIPIVRYINFHLLEEALSMTLGLLLALTFFGVISI